MPELVLPDARYRASYLEAKEALGKEGSHFLQIDATFEDTLRRTEDWSHGRNLPELYVPVTSYWLVEGDTFLGMIDIRHRLTEILENVGGHIGYAVAPAHRGKGYGTFMLRLALPKAYELGIKEARITCDSTNTASRRIIEANGGTLIDERDLHDGGPTKLRFRVPTTPEG